MKRWKKHLAVVSGLLILIIIQVRNPEIFGPYKGILGNILNPFVYMANRVAVNYSTLFEHYIYLVDAAKENTKLKGEINRLQFENSLLSEKLVQLDNLNRLFQFKDLYDFDTTAANVIGRNMDGYISYIIIDRGAKDGLNINDPVVSSRGLVGRVNMTYFTTSQVVVLYHHDFNASVLNSRTRAVGILKGDGRGGLDVDYYDRLDDVRLGDTFVTSGLGQLYPKGIAVGIVSDISAPSYGLFQKLSIRSTVDFYKLEQVLVVKSKTGGK